MAGFEYDFTKSKLCLQPTGTYTVRTCKRRSYTHTEALAEPVPKIEFVHGTCSLGTSTGSVRTNRGRNRRNEKASPIDVKPRGSFQSAAMSLGNAACNSGSKVAVAFVSSSSFQPFRLHDLVSASRSTTSCPRASFLQPDVPMPWTRLMRGY